MNKEIEQLRKKMEQLGNVEIAEFDAATLCMIAKQMCEVAFTILQLEIH